MALPNLPGYITPKQAREFAQHIVDFLNENKILATDEDITLDRVEQAYLKAGHVGVWMTGNRVPNTWGLGSLIPIHVHNTTNNHVEETLPWIEALGIDPVQTMEIKLWGPYLEVTGFVSAGAGEWPADKVLRHEGRDEGYQKFTIDIPIIENGEL